VSVSTGHGAAVGFNLLAPPLAFFPSCQLTEYTTLSPTRSGYNSNFYTAAGSNILSTAV